MMTPLIRRPQPSAAGSTPCPPQGRRPARQRTGLTALGLLLCSMLLLAACGGKKAATDSLAADSQRPDATGAIVVPAGAPLVLGASVTLTGPDAANGLESRDAVVAAVNRWKAANGNTLTGHAIQIRAEDDGCTDPVIAAQAAERLLRLPGLVGVLGPDCSGGAEAALPLYMRAGVVTIAGAATRSDLTSNQPDGGFFFRTAYRNDAQGALIGQFIGQTLQAKTAYVIDDAEPYGADLAEASAGALREQGVQVMRASVPRGAVDFSAVTATVAAARPDFVGFAGFNPEVALFYRQLRDAGYQGPFGATDAAASALTFIEPVGATLAEGVYFSGCSPTLAPDFIRDFRAVHGREPESSAFTAHYADATRILLDAVKAVAVAQPDGSLRIDPAMLRDAVRATTLSDGLSGAIAFDAKGDRTSSAPDLNGQARDVGLAACQVQNGALVTIFP